MPRFSDDEIKVFRRAALEFEEHEDTRELFAELEGFTLSERLMRVGKDAEALQLAEAPADDESRLKAIGAAAAIILDEDLLGLTLNDPTRPQICLVERNIVTGAGRMADSPSITSSSMKPSLR